MKEQQNPRQKIAGDLVDADAEKIAELRAGDGDGDSVGEADDDRARDEFHGGAQSGGAEDHQKHAGHQRAHVEAVDAVLRDDAVHHDDEGAGGAADLSLRAAQRGDQEARDDGAVEAGLRRHSGGDGEGHGQRQGYESYGDAGDEVAQEGAGVVMP